MYGILSRICVLYHGIDYKIRDLLTIDRDHEMANTDFALESEKTKDKSIYSSIGFNAALI